MQRIEEGARKKQTWEPVRLTAVGNLGVVMQNNLGSVADGMTPTKTP